METYIRLYSVLVILFFSITVQSQDRRFELNDINRVVTISNLQISPDGKSAIFMTSRRNLENNRLDRSLVLLEIETKKQEEISVDMPGITSPSWNPDGTGISFIAKTKNLGQVHMLNLKSRQLSVVTNSESNINRFAWGPHGKKIAYLTRDEQVETAGIDKFNNAFEVGSNDYLTTKTPQNTSVWVVNADGSNPHKITPDGFTVATGLSTTALSWSSDGKMLAFTQYPSSFSGDSDLGRNFIYKFDSHELKQATQNSRKESSPKFHPDNRHLIYQYPRDGVASNITDWFQLDLQSGHSFNLTETLDYSVYDINWLKDGTMLLIGHDNWGSAIWQMNNGQFKKVPLDNLTSVSGLSIAKDGNMVINGTKKNYPVEIYYKEDINANPEPLTNLNEFIKDISLGGQEGIEWKSSDGLQPNGILTYPPNFDPNNKYPLVLYIHGGPSAASRFGFHPFVQAMAAKGWIIFQPNYRGSNNLGNKFQSAISKDPSEGPGHDVITGVRVLKEKPYIDSGKIAVSGWSYGGWMTAWLIGRYPSEWAAAMAGAAPVDFTDMYSLNDLNRMRRHAIVESPYVGDNLQWAYDNSPISNFSKIKTPTLIMSKTGDYRVTVTGSYKLYGALRDNNIPVQFIAYPGPGHFPNDPVRSLDVYKRWMDWLETYIGSEGDTLKN